MYALVTGASGFLGGAVAHRLLAEGARVRVLVRRTSDLDRLAGLPVEVMYGDLNDAASLIPAATGVDLVVHCAARVSEVGSAEEFIRENVTATTVLLAAARSGGCRRFVYISSPSVVMDRDGGDQVFIDESVPYPARFLNLYSATKAAAERDVLAADATGFATCALRPRAIWGRGDTTGPIIRVLQRAAARRLPDLSGGRPVYASLCHVDNIVEACIRASSSERVGGRAYFVADAEQTDVWPFLGEVCDGFGLPRPGPRVPLRLAAALVAGLELAWRLPALVDREPLLSRYAVALLTRTATYDTSAARRDFGYRPVISRADGLADFQDWATDLDLLRLRRP